MATTLFRLLLSALLLLIALPAPSRAEPADIAAAARGVVRVVIIDRRDGQVTPLSHGSGFAVAPERVVTNAHVVRQAVADPSLAIGIVPSDGGDAIYARLVTLSDRNDLALLATTSPMALPPLTISGNPSVEAGAVIAVGYPMNVDRAQGLSAGDLFRAVPPVKSSGFLSGRRPSRDFDTLLHTAPIARGNSGGPLLDECGRVVGVNSFGAESGSADAEFFFAVSTRELLPFLTANSVVPRVNASPCRSLADLEAAEASRAERAAQDAARQAAADAASTARRQADARQAIEFEIIAERENGMAATFLLLIAGFAAALYGMFLYEFPKEGDTARGPRIAFAVAGLALLGAGGAWASRPGFGQVEGRLADRLLAERQAETGTGNDGGSQAGNYVCVLDESRSRVVGDAAADVTIDWSADGCVNGRTQYALTGGHWTRILVPEDEAAVTINRFDPAKGEYRVDRYLLGRDARAEVREARGTYSPPQCGGGPAAGTALAQGQQAILAMLPPQPNERLAYSCSRNESAR
ncbi:S1 family peptidase [Croceibacterium ferulae]|uniref:S1 family peptidase n=1 Tax=Croceibacterium ferulae TaxID=1854641 RepID=UPI000EAFD832|nr:serine protease [Croceibacterium ferulae]